MTVGGLIELLEEYEPDAELRLAIQPHWLLSKIVTGRLVADPDGRVWIGELGEVGSGESPYVAQVPAVKLWDMSSDLAALSLAPLT